MLREDELLQERSWHFVAALAADGAAAAVEFASSLVLAAAVVPQPLVVAA